LERTDGKNSKLFSFLNRAKPAWLQGFRWTKRTAPRKISSQARYDHFDTAPYMLNRCFSSLFFDEKGLWKELTERTANLFNFRTG